MGDYFQSNTACDDLVCIVSPASAESEYAMWRRRGLRELRLLLEAVRVEPGLLHGRDGLVCDLVLPDPAFLASLTRASDDADCDGQQCGTDGGAPGERYLGDIVLVLLRRSTLTMRVALVLPALAILLCCMNAKAPDAQAPGPRVVVETASGARHEVRVDLARTDVERARGLVARAAPRTRGCCSCSRSRRRTASG